jgi:hypothetical protein
MEQRMIPIAERLIVTLIFCLIVTAAMAQNADFDNSMQGWSGIMWGPGARIAVLSICSYLGMWGFANQHLWVSFCSLMGAIAYFATGTLLGKMSIV